MNGHKYFIPIVILVGIMSMGCKDRHENVTYFDGFSYELTPVPDVFEFHGLADPMAIILFGDYMFIPAYVADTVFQRYKLPDMVYDGGFGRRGRGPDEYVSTPILFSAPYTSSLYMYVWETGMLRNYALTEGGDFQLEKERFTVYGNLYNELHILRDSILVYNDIANDQICKIDLSWNFETETIDMKQIDRPGDDTKGSLAANNTHIAYAYNFKRDMRIYGLDDMELKNHLIWNGRRNTATSITHYVNLHMSDRYIYAFMVEYVDVEPPKVSSPNRLYYLDVHDLEGNPVVRYHMKNFGTAWAISDDDRYVYTCNTRDGEYFYRYEMSHAHQTP